MVRHRRRSGQPTPPSAASRPATSSLAVNSTEVGRRGDVEKAIADAAKAGRKAVLVQVTRDDTSRFVALPVAKG